MATHRCRVVAHDGAEGLLVHTLLKETSAGDVPDKVMAKIRNIELVQELSPHVCVLGPFDQTAVGTKKQDFLKSRLWLP